jgi:hypothetical protein
MQRLHKNSLLYTKWDKGESLRAKARRTSSDVSETIQESENPVLCSNCAPVDPQNDPWVKISASKSDIVAIGKITRLMSELTPNEAFVFSDAQFVPTTVMYQSSQSSEILGAVTGKELTITFPGGQVAVDGYKLASQLSTEPPLRIGETYLLFLQYLPASQSFSLVGIKGFDLASTTVRPLHHDSELQSRPIMSNRTSFTAAIQSSINRMKLEAQQ